MEDSGHQDAALLGSIKDDVLSVLHAAQAGPDIITSATQFRIIGKLPARCFNPFDVAKGLFFAPGAQAVCKDVHQVGFGQPGEAEPGHS